MINGLSDLTDLKRADQHLAELARRPLLQGEDGEPLPLLASSKINTDNKTLETQHLRAQRMESLGILVGGIAHDIKNVLAPILMSVELLRMSATDENMLETLELLQSSALRAVEMVKHIVSFASGIEGQRLLINPIHITAEILQLAADTFPPTIQLEDRSSADLWCIVASPTQVYQALLNLCINARDALPNGGRLGLSLENVVLDDFDAQACVDATPGPYVAITVTDNGTGVPAGIQGRIFEPFFTTKEPGKGTGLGLSMVLDIVKGHGGFVRIKSEVGEGTAIALYFPAVVNRDHPPDGRQGDHTPR